MVTVGSPAQATLVHIEKSSRALLLHIWEIDFVCFIFMHMTDLKHIHPMCWLVWQICNKLITIWWTMSCERDWINNNNNNNDNQGDPFVRPFFFRWFIFVCYDDLFIFVCYDDLQCFSSYIFPSFVKDNIHIIDFTFVAPLFLSILFLNWFLWSLWCSPTSPWFGHLWFVP